MKRRVAVDLSVLRESRDLRLLVIGELFSGLGAQAALVAIPYQIYVLTHSAALVGLLGIVELVPIVFGSLFGGAIADRIERRRLMFFGQALTFASATGLALTAFASDPPVALVFLFAGTLAGGSAVDNVARSAIIPALAKDRLRAALSINYGLYQVAAVVGPGLGGLMIAAFGVASAYTADAIGFLVMMIVTTMLPKLPPVGAGEEHPPIMRVDRRGPEVRAPQQRADGLVRDRPRGDDLRHAARAVRRPQPDRLRRGRERHRPALRLGARPARPSPRSRRAGSSTRAGSAGS